MAFETSLSIKVDTDKAVANIRKTDVALKKLGRSANDNSRKITGATQKMKRGFVGLKVAIAALGLGLIAKNIVSVASKFEQLRVQLKTVTGSVTAAAIEFQKIKDLAADTPFQVSNLTTAFIRLKAVGIQPTKDLMVAFSDVAAAFGRDITDFSRAAVGAAFGETEALKSFGIAAKVEGEKISLTFAGVTRTVKRDAASVIGALQEIAGNFAGASKDQMATFKGAVSNLTDAWEDFIDTLNTETGLLDFLAEGVRNLTANLKSLKEIVEDVSGVFKDLEEKSLGALERQLKRNIEAIKQLQSEASKAGDLYNEAIGEKTSGERIAALKAENALIRQRIEDLKLIKKIGLPGRKPLAPTAQVDKTTATTVANLKDETSLLQLRIEKFNETQNVIDGLVTAKEILNETSRRGVTLTKAEKDEIHDTIVAHQRAKKTLKDLGEGKKIFEEMRTPLEKYNVELERLNELLSVGAIKKDAFKRKVEEMNKELLEGDKVFQQLKSTTESFVDGLVDGLASGESAAKSFKRVMINALLDIQKQLIKTALTGGSSGGGGLLGSIFSGIGGLFGGGGGGADLMRLGTPTATLAEGGIVTKPTLAMIGEKGEHEAVIPLSKMGQMGGTVINIDARGSNGDAAVEAAVERGIRQASPQLINASINRVKEERQRDPAFFGAGNLA